MVFIYGISRQKRSIRKIYRCLASFECFARKIPRISHLFPRLLSRGILIRDMIIVRRRPSSWPSSPSSLRRRKHNIKLKLTSCMVLSVAIKVFLLSAVCISIIRSVDRHTLHNNALQNPSLTCARPITLALMLKIRMFSMSAKLSFRVLSIRATCPRCIMLHIILTLELQ